MNTRTHAAQILVELFQRQHSLNNILTQKLTNLPHTHDRGFIQELCYGLLRWYWQLDHLSSQLLQRPLKEKDFDIKILILLGIYQLLHLQTPPHAAIHETVQAARELHKSWATGLINGVLRQFLRLKNELLIKSTKISTAHFSHPQWLLDTLQLEWPENWQNIAAANNQRPPMTLRVNHLKQARAEYLKLLLANNIAAEVIEHTSDGIILAQPCDVTKLPRFAEGAVSVQDTAAQLAAVLLELAPGQRVLDACAAPGGKTAHILETETNLENLTIVDVDGERLKKIEGNLRRLNLYPLPIINLLTADAAQSPQWWDGKLFDRILLDAPCSATGVIRRHPDIKLLRRAQDIPTLAQLQTQLLNSLWPLLKPHGLLVYATCSVLPEENTKVLENFLAAHPDAQEKIIESNWGTATRVGKQIFPGENNMDGFYYGRLIKTHL